MNVRASLIILLIMSALSSKSMNFKVPFDGADTLDVVMNLDSAYGHFSKMRKSEFMEGYTVQLFSGDRSNANLVRARVVELGGDNEARIVYKEPHFKIHIGSYPDALSAERALRGWLTAFPDAFIVQTQVPWYPLPNPSAMKTAKPEAAHSHEQTDNKD